METNARLLSTIRTKTMVTPKHNPSHVRRHTLPSQPSQLLITQFRLNKHNFSTSLAAPKANPIFHAANKNLILKHISTLAILLLHPPFISHNLARGLTTLSEETTQRKHTYVTLSPSLTTNFPSLLTNQLLQLKTPYKNSGYKMVPPR